MRSKRMLAAITGVSLLAVMLLGCASEVPDTDPQMRGVVVSAPQTGTGTGTIRVVWHELAGEKAELDSIDATIGEDTDVFAEDGSRIAYSDLLERDIVEVWITGPIAESYPPQGSASAVRVIGAFDAMRPLPIPPGLIEPQ